MDQNFDWLRPREAVLKRPDTLVGPNAILEEERQLYKIEKDDTLSVHKERIRTCPILQTPRKSKRVA